MIPMSDASRGSIYRAYREAVRTGTLTLFILTRAGGEIAYRGMLTYAPHAGRKTAGAVKSLESAGVRVSVFLKDHSDVDIRAVGECGLTEEAPVLSLRNTDVSVVDLMDEGRRAFTDCTPEQIETCIRALKDRGRTVAVLSVEREDVPLLNAADVAITCAPALYVAAEGGHPRLPGNSSAPDGTANSPLATDITRRRADVVVRRATHEGGGIVGVRRALLCADHIKDTMDRVFTFMLLSQTARLLLVTLSVLLGAALPAASALLLSGMGVDLLILLSAVGLPHPTIPHSRRSMEAGITTPLTTYFRELIAVTVAVTLPTLAVAICRFCDVDFGGDMSHFLILCLAGLQLVLYRGTPLPRRDRTVFFTTMALILYYVAALAVALAAGLNPLWALAIPLACPVLYLAVRPLVKGAGRRGK